MRHLAWPAAALLAALLLLLAPAPPAAQAGPPGGVWEYRLLVWEEADTAAVIRQVAGADELADPVQLAQALERQQPLLDDPRIIAAVEARLAGRLNEVGLERWEAFWVRENIALIGGAPLRVPSVLLKRERS